MSVFFLTVAVICIVLQMVMKKEYNRRGGESVFGFSAMTTVFAIPVFIFSSGGSFEFSPEVLPVTLAFATAFCVSLISMMLAVMTGPLSLSSLINQYSLIIPTFYGIMVLGEPLKATVISGLIFLFISLALINLEKKGEEKKITLKWAFYAFLNFVGNGSCAAIQKAQQAQFGGQYKEMFMIIAFVIGAVLMAVLAVIYERKSLAYELRRGFVWYTVSGLAMGIVNLFVLILANMMPASLMFPIISAGGIIVTAAVSIFLYREKLSFQQKAGLFLGTLAIIILNI